MSRPPVRALWNWLIALTSAAWLAAGPFPPTSAQADPPPDASWMANAVVGRVQVKTVSGLGAAQGVCVRAGHIYLYGDVADAAPRVGVIREYTRDLKPTGRVVWLRRQGKPVLVHPTGLTWDRHWGTFLGDTVQQKATIYRLDWERMWQDGSLEHALLERIADDAAVNGCRPEFVTLGEQRLLATADYGDVRPEIRLYDPERLVAAGRSSAPGVVVHRVLCGPFEQNLYWDPERGHLICIQNVIAGRGWQLEVLDLAKAVADGRASGPGVRVRLLTFPPHDELEGFRPLDAHLALFVTSGRCANVILGEIQAVPPRCSPPGQRNPASLDDAHKLGERLPAPETAR